MEKYTALDLLFETGLRHLYHAEQAISHNLVTLADQAFSPHLKEMFVKHRRETEKQIHRLEKIFQLLDIDLKASKLQGLHKGMAEKAKEILKTLADMNFRDLSKGIEGILSEGKELLRHFANTEANDFALVNAGQNVEYFEISCYRFLVLMAERAQRNEVASLLQESLNEELEMRKRIAVFAESELEVVAPVAK